MNAVHRLSRITLICRDPDRLADFYEAGFEFVRTAETSTTDPAFAALMRIAGATARVITLQLGGQKVELTDIQPPGGSYPRGVSGRSLLFQHFAIVVSDMAAAYARLSAWKGWEAISTDGPQVLPASSGGVTAYKFRDPEGHPLELLAFASDAIPAEWRRHSVTECLGIDHSAISVADTERSLIFYTRLGLRRTGSSLNVGPQQDKLDAVAAAVVEVTALAPSGISTPHVELLCYRRDFQPELAVLEPNDVAATRLVLTVESDVTLRALCAQNAEALLSGPIRLEHGTLRAMLRVPDGHLVCLEVLQ